MVKTKTIVLLFILVTYSFMPGVAYGQYQNSVSGDRQALVELYQATNGANWKNSSGWLNGDPSDKWYGVEVDGSGRVVRVDLSDNNLRGTGGLPASIGNLKQMRYLNVMHNQVSGPLPETLFSQCQSLVHLYLNYSDAYLDSGGDDPHIEAQTGGGDLHTGKRDRGAKNKFTGQVPSSTNLPNLEWFLLSWTEISDIDLDAIFSNSPNLKAFLIANNVNMGGLEKTVPSSIGNLTGMIQLALTGAQTGADAFGGELPSSFSNLVNMEHLRLGNHAFTGAFPDLSGWSKLKTFGASKNRWTSGWPLYGLTGSWQINAFGTAWSGNSWTDASLPETVDDGIRTLDVVESNLSGPLPPGVFARQIIVTNFSHNNLSGPTPADLRHLVRIRNLRWSNNDLSGQWPDLDWTNKQGLRNSAGTVVHPLRAFTRAHFDNNRYVFSDMLVVSDQGKTLFEWYKQEADVSFRYGNQKPFGSLAHASGSTIDFSGVVTHPDNRYRWYRNGQQISGAISSVIDAGAHGDGTYRLEVTNPNVPGLTLMSIEINMPEDGNSSGTGSGTGSGGDTTTSTDETEDSTRE